jgi:Tol biopolymer transport system component
MRKLIFFAFAVAGFSASAFSADRHIAFERDNAIYIANLDGTNEKKLADGIFPAISPDGTRVAFNTVEKTRDTTYVRHMAVADVATGMVNVFKDAEQRRILLHPPEGKRKRAVDLSNVVGWKVHEAAR